MSIEVLVAAPNKRLTTTAKVKAVLGITGSDQDTNISDLIDAASDFVVTYTGRDFAQQTVRESLVNKGTPDMLLSLTPVVELESVSFDDAEIEGWTLWDDKAGIIQKSSGVISTNIPTNSIDRHPSSYFEKRYHVVYTGGYILPDWGSSHGTRNLPYDLERAVIDIVKAQFLTLKFDGTMKSYKIGETMITWDKGVSGQGAEGAVTGLVPNSALSVLMYYRRAF